LSPREGRTQRPRDDGADLPGGDETDHHHDQDHTGDHFLIRGGDVDGDESGGQGGQGQHSENGSGHTAGPAGEDAAADHHGPQKLLRSREVIGNST
jgi:hypothetical protein